MKFPSPIVAAAWSLCSRLIAVIWGGPKATIEILDAVTLGRLSTLEFPLSGTQWLIFSPGTHLLTWFGENPGKFISWDIQTGVLVSVISPEPWGYTIDYSSATYSVCGTILGVLFRNGHTFTISTYNVLSGTHLHSHSIEGLALDEIWTHSKYLRFATINSGSIITWEAGFTQTHRPTEVGSLPIPSDSHHPGHFLLYHNLSRFAFITGGRVKIWNTQDSKFLLDSTDAKWPRQMSLSTNGHFFACGTNGPEFYVWKESPTGYILHQKLTSSTMTSKPLISPNGESIIAFGDSVIQLWCTMDSTASVSTMTQAPQRSKKHFTLGFSPDGTLAAITRVGDETVTILDLRSGISQLIIDVGIKVYGLGVSGSTIIVVGEGMIVTWNLPTGNYVPNLRMNVDDSIQTTIFNYSPFPTLAPRPTISVSPDLHYIAIVEGYGQIDSYLYLYDVHTGQCLASVPTVSETSPWFTMDGHQVWCVTDSGEAELWGIVKYSTSDVTELEHLDSTTHPPDNFPWQLPHNYSIMDNQWILTSGGKRLLWLPPHWRSDGWNRMWSRQFLALLDHGLPDPVIVKLE